VVDPAWAAVSYIALVAVTSMTIRVAEKRIEREGGVGRVALNRTERSPSCTATPGRMASAVNLTD
jgi:hypothetical protein